MKKTKKHTKKIYLTENFIQKALTKIDDRTNNKTCEESLTNNGEYNNININDTNNILENFDNIKLTDEQIEALQNEYGASNTNEATEYLSLYKKSSGREYKDDYATIKLWVMDNVIRNENNYTRKQKEISKIDYEQYYDVGN